MRHLAWSLVFVLGTAGLVAGAEEVREDRVWVGVVLDDAPEGQARVVAVVPEGPAWRAGVKAGDVVLAVGDRVVHRRADLAEALITLEPGKPVRVALLRDEHRKELELVPVVRSADPVREAVERTARRAARAPAYRLARRDAGFSVVAIPEELRKHYGAPENAGVLVDSVREDSPAEKAGIRVGDVIVRAGETPLVSPSDLTSRLLVAEPGEVIPLERVRNRERAVVSLATEAAPEPRPVVSPLAGAYVLNALEAREAASENRVRMLEEEIRALRERIRVLEEELEKAQDRR